MSKREPPLTSMKYVRRAPLFEVHDIPLHPQNAPVNAQFIRVSSIPQIKMFDLHFLYSIEKWHILLY